MPHVDQLFTHGRIVTLDEDKPEVEAIAVAGGRVLATGSNAELASLAGAGTEVVDLGGQTVVPGFHDAHCHVLLFGLSLVEPSARAAAAIPEIAGVVGSAAARARPGEWIRCKGYDQNKLAERRHPTRHDLDPVSRDHPVFLQHVSGHMLVANSRALALARIGRGAANPEGGEIVRDAAGEPTGLLTETAQELVKSVLPAYTLAETRAALAAAGRAMAAEGITSAQDAWAGWIAPDELRAYREATADGALPQRVRLLWDVEDWTRKGRPRRTAEPLGERLALGGIKLFLDGSLIGRTAALTRPYLSPPGVTGFLVKSEATILEQVRAAHERGWQVSMHAIGDRAIEAALAAIAAVMGAEAGRLRPRIEHCGILRPELLDGIRRAGAVVVTQPRFLAELGDGFRDALGEERLRLTYPMASLRGLHAAFSSDRPVVNGAPLLGIQAAMLQRTESGAPYVPAEAIPFEEALRHYTLGAAYSAFEEAVKGALVPGRWADFAVLSRDPRTTPAEELGAVQVLRTVVGGRTAFAA